MLLNQHLNIEFQAYILTAIDSSFEMNVGIFYVRIKLVKCAR